MHRLYGVVLGFHVVCLSFHLGCQVYVCVSKVSYCCPVLRRRLGEVCEGLFDVHQVVGSIAALARGFLPLPVVVLCLNEVGLKDCSVFVILVTPVLTVFRVLALLNHQCICDADYLGL